MDTTFLQSNRFWVMVGVAVIGILKTYGILEASLADILIGTGLGFIGVRTVDRFGENVNKYDE